MALRCVAVQAGEERFVPDLRTNALCVDQDPVGLVDSRQRRARMKLADLSQVAVEQRLLHGLSAQQVKRHRQDRAVEQDVVVTGEDRL